MFIFSSVKIIDYLLKILYNFVNNIGRIMLEIQNISFSVKEDGKKKDILKNISFSCEDNETIVITGKNGSGKSTLLKILMGIEKASSGKIFLDGKDISNLTIDERANLSMSYSFQTPVRFKGISVKDLLTIAQGKNSKLGDFCDILSQLGLCARDYVNRPVDNKLSGGEQKRIDIASVLARKSKVNLFDEPEAGIDIFSFDNLINLLIDKNRTNIIVSHQRKLIEKANRVLLLDGGKIVAFDKPNIVLEILDKNSSCKKLEVKNG